MSWSVTLEATSISHLQEGIDAAIEKSPYPGGDVTVKDQIDIAKEAALTIANSGAIGDKNKLVDVTLSGHSNPNHEPRGGWSNDTITIIVSQV